MASKCVSCGNAVDFEVISFEVERDPAGVDPKLSLLDRYNRAVSGQSKSKIVEKTDITLCSSCTN